MNTCLAPVLFNMHTRWGYRLIIARIGLLAAVDVNNDLYYDISDSMYYALEGLTASFKEPA
jgi:hypothetical protein